MCGGSFYRESIPSAPTSTCLYYRDLVTVPAASQKKFCRRPLVDITGQTRTDSDSVLQPVPASDGVHILAAPRLNALARPVAATKRKGSGWPRMTSAAPSTATV